MFARNATKTTSRNAKTFQPAGIKTANDRLLADFADFRGFAGRKNSFNTHFRFNPFLNALVRQPEKASNRRPKRPTTVGADPLNVQTGDSLFIERNKKRSGLARVPDNVIWNMKSRYKIPSLDEGFDEIWHVDAEGVITKEVKS
jgi:hypothetical protein